MAVRMTTHEENSHSRTMYLRLLESLLSDISVSQYRIAGKVGGEFTLANWRFFAFTDKL